MKVLHETSRLSAVAILRSGGIVVLKTDTIYGLLASANNQAACRRVYDAKGRDAEKGCIILIADPSQMWDGVSRAAYTDAAAKIEMTEPTSIIVPTDGHTPAWLPHGADGSLAFRVPADDELKALLRQTGPVIAPSANPQGEEPAVTIKEAERYFGEAVDMYVDGGFLSGSHPSRVVRFHEDGTVEYVR